ncbi:type II secretion system F family protein [Salinibacterium sp. NG253]|uniref:type II secretion system F family protein n=1 Tax=Salinibacterium sp. NG253 TaxID=2792039 RepID=UPI0018CD55B5|nr:type II secretion system F family protein [Salinibacterium sp. NG253]MBH0117994.1 type II secretion system F family protein [Salinibacterium sp. NG253]
MSDALAWSLVAGIAGGLGLWSILSLIPRLSRPTLATRVAPYVIDVSAGAREHLAPRSVGPLPVLGILLVPVARWLRETLASVVGGSDQILRRLRQSGSELTLEAYRSQQLLAVLGGAMAGVAFDIAVANRQQVPFAAQAVLVVVGGVAGITLRDYLLQRAAKNRIRRLTAELPVVLEFLALSLSAGEGILDAVRRVSHVGGGELSRELARVVSSVNTGLPFGETLGVLARELELAPFSRCVDQILGALDRGSPLSEVLQAQAQDAREESKRDLLELAGKKEVAMLFPLVFLILPITIAFAIFPGIFVLQVGF